MAKGGGVWGWPPGAPPPLFHVPPALGSEKSGGGGSSGAGLTISDFGVRKRGKSAKKSAKMAKMAKKQLQKMAKKRPKNGQKTAQNGRKTSKNGQNTTKNGRKRRKAASLGERGRSAGPAHGTPRYRCTESPQTAVLFTRPWPSACYGPTPGTPRCRHPPQASSNPGRNPARDGSPVHQRSPPSQAKGVRY